MTSSENNSVNFAVEDKDAGYRYQLSLDDQQYHNLTIAQVQQMIVEVSRDTSVNMSQSQNHSLTSQNNASGASVKHHTGPIPYESTVTPLSTTAAHPTHVAALLPGSFALLDTANNPLRDGSERAAPHIHLQRDPPLRVVRNHLPTTSPPLMEQSPMHATASSTVSSSAVLFVIDSDAESRTAESVSFHEDLVSLTYHTLMPSEQIPSSAQSLQFETDNDDDTGAATVEFDTISFATVDTAATPEKPRTAASEAPSTTTAATVASGTSAPTKKATTFSDPVAHMTAQRRFEYYQARANRKKKTQAAASSPSPAPAAAPTVLDVPAVPAATTGAPSVTVSSTTASTAQKKAAKKSVQPKAEATGKQPAPAGVVAPPQQPPAMAAATERETKLAALVQQLQEDVQSLLVQSQNDASRIAALRDALTDTQKEYRALHDAHCSSLAQLNAYAAQIATGVLPVPPQEGTEDAEERKVEKAAGAPIASPAAPAENAEPQPRQQEKEQALTSETVAEAPATEHDGAADAAEAEAEAEAMVPALAADSTDVSPATAVPETEAPSAVENGNIDKNNDKDESEGEQASAAAAEEKVPTAQVNTTAEAELATSPSAPLHTAQPLLLTPIPALHQLSESEIRALLKQLGYIYHNRLLRRENALLMSQLQLLKGAAATKRKHAGAKAARRLRVVVRIRPVGVSSAVDAHRDDLPHVVPPPALTSPDSPLLRNNSAKVLSPQERSVGEGHNPLYASSIVSPLLSPHSMSVSGKEQASAAAAAAAAGVPTAPGDVFLQCDLAEGRLQVRNPDSLMNTTTATTTARDGAAATLRGVRIVGPPLPQSLASVVGGAGVAVAQVLEASTSGAEDGGATAAATDGNTTSALRAAAAVQQRSLYTETVTPLVEAALRGKSGTVIAYGQVGSGKTYSIFGDCTAVAATAEGNGNGVARDAHSPAVYGALPAEAGVVPRAIADLFDQLRDRAASEELLLRSLYASRHDAAFQAALGSHATAADADAAASVNLVALSRVPMCEVRCTMVELYGDKVRDLLAPKITVPIYEEFFTTSAGVKGSAGYRSSSAERRMQRQLRQAQAAQQNQRESAICSARRARSPETTATTTTARRNDDDKGNANDEQRRVVGFEHVSPECVVRAGEGGAARVEGATCVTLQNAAAALAVIQRGLTARETHATASNPQSSRSHVIFTVTVTQQQWWCEAAEEAGEPGKTAKLSPEVSMDDVAKTGATKKTHKKTNTTTTTAATAKKPAKKAKTTATTAGTTRTKKKSMASATSADAEPEAEPTTSAAAKPAKSKKTVTIREESVATTAAAVEEQENTAQDGYLRRRFVKAVTSELVFVDLAGTDRSTGQVSSGDAERLREAQAIGKSLVALGDVMSVLYGGSGITGTTPGGKASTSGVGAHVPFRSHKLTMLLRDALVKPTACVVLACLALSEQPMTALLSDAAAAAAVPVPVPTSSASLRSTSPALQAPPTAEKLYWRVATERFLAAPHAKPTTTSKRTGDAAASPIGGAPHLASPAAASASSSPHRPTQLSVRRSSLHPGVFAPSAEELAGKRKATSKSTALSSRRQSASLLHMHETSLDSEDEDDGRAGRKSTSLRERSFAVQHFEALQKAAWRAEGSRRPQPPQEPSVNPEFAAELNAIQANAEAEDRAAVGALWITPRETVSTLMFLSRLWKA